MAWNPEDKMEKRKRIAWSIASSTCIKTKEDPSDVYKRVMATYEESDKHGQQSLCESNKTS